MRPGFSRFGAPGRRRAPAQFAPLPLDLRNWRCMRFKPLLALGFFVLFARLPAASPQADGLPANETLYYKIEWRLFTAGQAKVEFAEVSQSPHPDYQLSLHLESSGAVFKLFKVEDDYTVSLNRALCAQSSHMISHEGGRQRETTITFDGEAKKAHYLERDRVKNTVVLQQDIDIPV